MDDDDSFTASVPLVLEELGERQAGLRFEHVREQFTAELEELLSRIRNLPRQPGVAEVRIPSERGFHEREIRRRQGILVNKVVVDRLRKML